MKAEMFNRKAASPESKPDEILKALDIKPGQKIADIGSGGGYFSMRFAREVGGEGTVYALDVNKDFLQHISSDAAKQGLKNIKTIPISGRPDLPEKVDIIFMRNLYHHLSDRLSYIRELQKFLKPGGRLVIIDHKPGSGGPLSFRRLFGHSTPKETIQEEATKAGYELSRDYDMLPEQNFLVFRRD